MKAKKEAQLPEEVRDMIALECQRKNGATDYKESSLLVGFNPQNFGREAEY